jgi:hypothetical protein
MVKNSIVPAVWPHETTEARAHSGPEPQTADGQGALGRFIWQLVGVLET